MTGLPSWLIFPWKSFNARLMIAVTLLLAGVSLILNLYFHGREKKQLQEAAFQNGRNLTRLLAQNSRLAVFTGNQGELTAQVEAVQAVFDGVLVSLHDQDGRVLSAKGGGIPDGILGLIQREVFEKTGETLPDPVFVNGHFLLVEPVWADEGGGAEDLFFGNEEVLEGEARPRKTIGHAVLVLDRKRIDRAAAANLRRNSGITLAVMLASCLLIQLAIHFLTRPLGRLALEIRTRGAARQEVPQPFIPADFREMIEDIRSAYLALDRLKETLEDKVVERTKALATSNAELREQKEAMARINDELSGALTRLRATQAQLIQSEKMAALGQLIGGLSHEVNNAVTFISTAVPLLEKNIRHLAGGGADSPVNGGASPGEMAEVLLGHVKEGVRRISELTRDLRTFSYEGSQEFTLVDLHQGLSAAVAIVRREYRSRIDIVEDLDPRLPFVRGHAGQLNQVFMNLLLNAAQAIPGPGRITVRTRCEGGAVRVEISDTGRGIPPESLGRIFDPFFTTKPMGEGSGLGLSISYSIIERHGGRIEVDSKVGTGSIFLIVLPV